MAGSASVREGVAAGSRALAQGAWDEARSAFESVLERDDDPAALEGLSWTFWWAEDLEACLTARERAYRGYHAAGDQRGAARMAQWIGDDHLWFGGAPALADLYARALATQALAARSMDAAPLTLAGLARIRAAQTEPSLT